MENGISLLSIGNELLDGRTTDTNATYFGDLLRTKGYSLKHVLSVRDNLVEIKDALDFLLAHSQYIVISGGLGPTSDDLTRQVVAEYCQTELKLDEEDLLRLRQYFQVRKRQFSETNKSQSYFPVGSEIIQNSVGTASGFTIDYKGVPMSSLPGVPKEFYQMLNDSVLPNIEKRCPQTNVLRKETLRMFDMAESHVAGVITGCDLDDKIDVSYRAHFPELEIQLSTVDSEINVEEAKELVSTKLNKDFIYTNTSGKSLPQEVVELLQESNKKISFAESCTGGTVAKLLTDFSGVSSFFLGSAVTYSNEAKQSILGVSTQSLESYGAVSFDVAKEMATGARNLYGSDLALSITGIAGPTGGSEQKPIGTYYVGLATPEGVQAFMYFFGGNREYVRMKASYNAIDLIRRYLTGLPFTGKQG